jgi:uncharacterized membrane protein (DUF106 family)
VLEWFYSLHPFIYMLIISFLVTLFVTVIYKYTTDQDKMKSLKAEIKKSQDEMKKYRDDPKKMMEINKKAMSANMEYMKDSMKSTIWTMIPILLIFGYLSSHVGYVPIMPNTEFTTTVEFKEGTTGTIDLYSAQLDVLDGSVKNIVDNKATWRLKGPAGKYVLEYRYKDKPYTQKLLITSEQTYEKIEIKIKDSDIKSMKINNEKILPMQWTHLPWLQNWGWLGTYILLSIVFSIGLRKMMKLN